MFEIMKALLALKVACDATAEPGDQWRDLNWHVETDPRDQRPRINITIDIYPEDVEFIDGLRSLVGGTS